MRLFNTLTQRIEPLEPTGNRVTLYVCGITPYDTTHLGHAFINVVYDTLARYLRWRGLDVLYVQNVTDIDDDILRKAKKVVSIEENYSGQLATHIAAETGFLITDRINKYDGRPFSEDEMVKAISGALAGEKAEAVVTSVR